MYCRRIKTEGATVAYIGKLIKVYVGAIKTVHGEYIQAFSGIENRSGVSLVPRR
jgi:hypothetical protein